MSRSKEEGRGRARLTGHEDGAHDGSGKFRSAEDEDFRAKVGEGDEVGDHGHVIDAKTQTQICQSPICQRPYDDDRINVRHVVAMRERHTVFRRYGTLSIHVRWSRAVSIPQTYVLEAQLLGETTVVHQQRRLSENN